MYCLDNNAGIISKYANGDRVAFNYPLHFSMPAYVMRRGQVVRIARTIEAHKTSDTGGETMYLIVADDGWHGAAWEGELSCAAV